MTETSWAGPAESQPGAMVTLPNGHLGRVQPHSYHPTRYWAPVHDLVTGIHHSEMVADLKLAGALPAPDRRRTKGKDAKRP